MDSTGSRLKSVSVRGARPPKVRFRAAAALFEPVILRRAAVAAVRKLDPRVMIHIPVMFVVEIGSVITTIEFIDRPSLFVGLVTLWLWATVLFANFAEAVAEGRGKAQADTLRKARKDTVAQRLTWPGRSRRSRPPSSRPVTAASSARTRSSRATATSSRASPSSTSPRSPASPPR